LNFGFYFIRIIRKFGRIRIIRIVILIRIIIRHIRANSHHSHYGLSFYTQYKMS